MRSPHQPQHQVVRVCQVLGAGESGDGCLHVTFLFLSVRVRVHLHMIIHLQQDRTRCGHVSVTLLEVLDRTIVEVIILLVVLVSSQCSRLSSTIVIMTTPGQSAGVTIVNMVSSLLTHLLLEVC